MKLISVLMSVYKEPQVYVKKAVDSILNQTLREFQFLIIVDDPNNKEIIMYLQNLAEKDSRVQILINEENIGLARSLNKGLQYAEGEYIARMDADDIAKPERFDRELQYLKEKDLDLVSCCADVIDKDDTVWGEVGFISNNEQLITKLLPIQNIIIHPTVLVKTEVLRSVGGYRNFATCQDYDLWLRMLSQGYKIGILNEKLLLFRRHKDSVTAARRYNQVLNEQYICRLYNERIKDTNKDSFSENNLAQYLDGKGYNNLEVIKQENRRLLEYQEGVQALKDHEIFKAVPIIFRSIKSAAVRRNISVSVRAKLTKLRYRNM